MKRIRLGVFGVLLLLAGVSGAVVLAHVEPVDSDPVAGGTVPEVPDQVSVTFSGEVEPEGSSLTIIGPDGEQVAEGGVDLDNADRDTMVAELGEDLPSGEYTVNWVAVDAEDGDESSASFTFSVVPGAQPTAAAADTATVVVEAPEGTVTPAPIDLVEEGDDDDDALLGFSRGFLIVGLVTVVVAVMVVFAVGRRYWWR